MILLVMAVLVTGSWATTRSDRTSTTIEQTRNCAVKTVSLSKYIRDTLGRHESIERSVLEQLTSLSSMGHILQTQPTRRQVDGGSSIPAALLKSVYVLQKMVKITDDADAIIQSISPMDDEIKDVQYISRVLKNSNKLFYGKIMDFALEKSDSSRAGDQYDVFSRSIDDQHAKSLFFFVMAYEDHRYRETTYAQEFRVLIQMMKSFYELLLEAMMASSNEKRLDNLALLIQKIFLLRPAIQKVAMAFTESDRLDQHAQALLHHEKGWKKLYIRGNLLFKELEEGSAQSTTTTDAVPTATYTVPDLSDILLDNGRVNNANKGKRKIKNRNTRKQKPQAQPVLAVPNDETADVTEERKAHTSPPVSDIISAVADEDENPSGWMLVSKSSEKSKKTTRSNMNPQTIRTTVTTREATTSRTTPQMPTSKPSVQSHAAPKEEPISITTNAHRDEATLEPGSIAVTSGSEKKVDDDVSQLITVGTTAVEDAERLRGGGSTTINNSDLNVVDDTSPFFEPIYYGPVHGLVSGYLGIPLVKPPVDMLWYLSSQISDLSNQMEFFAQQASMNAGNDYAIGANVAQFRRKLNKARRAIEEMHLSADGLAQFVNGIPAVVLQQSSVN